MRFPTATWRARHSWLAIAALTVGCGSNDSSSSAAAGGASSAGGAVTAGGASSAGGPVTAGSATTGGGASQTSGTPDCAKDGDGRTTLVFVNSCSASVAFRGSDIDGGELAS